MTIDTDFAEWLGSHGLQVRRRVRVLMLLDAVDYAVLAPISVQRFHTLAFLADVLSPIFHLVPMSGKILKRRSFPYFPDLQWEIDRLIGLDLVAPLELAPVVEESKAYVTFALALQRTRSSPVLDAIYSESEFPVLRDYFRELAGALSNIQDADLDAVTRMDVTWDSGHAGAVIDYGEWRARNYSKLGADRIEELAVQAFRNGGAQLSPTAKVNLYVRYLKRVASG